jgi:predicted nucleic acid-binding protein
MQHYVLDTNIWIYLSKDYPELIELQANIAKGSIKPVLTPVTYVETLGYAKITPQQEQFFRRLFDSTEKLYLEQAHLEQVITWRQQGVKTKLPDLFVAACAKIANYPLLTRNEKDFISLDVCFENPWKI